MMELQMIDQEAGAGQCLFLNGKRTRYHDTEAEIKAKHWIATEIEKLIGLRKDVRITVEEWQS